MTVAPAAPRLNPSPPAALVSPPADQPMGQRLITIVLVLAPVIALGAGVPLLWGHAIHWNDIVLAVSLYSITGYGTTVGFHRLFAHRSFKATRALKVTLAVSGSLAVQGALIGWVANHRRHHMFSDQPGDPHSPWWPPGGGGGGRRGLVHAHVGWLFAADSTPAPRFAPDMMADSDLVLISRMFPLLAILSLAVPFAAGWIWSGSFVGGLAALLWAGVVRIALLHHVTWSVNSIGHRFGLRPFATSDNSTNFAPLAVLSLGESWHNFHHACPSSARHGVQPHQLDSSAALIRLLERAGWATKVRWPTAERVAQCRAG